MIKIDLITGFLGSGKTTFIKKYAKYLLSKGEKIAIIENDFGAINVDMMLLKELESDSCYLEMVYGAFDYDCHKRRFRSKLIQMAMMHFDRVIVEPSGIFDTDEFFDLLRDDPLDEWYQINNVITILDSNISSSLSDESKYIIGSELASSGIVLLSKINKHTNVENCTKEANLMLNCVDCPRILTSDEIISKSFDLLDDNDYNKILRSHYHEYPFVKKYQMEDIAYKSLFFLNHEVTIDTIKEITNTILTDVSFGNVIRIKGFIKNDNSWFELNTTKTEYSLKPLQEGQAVIIVIGENLNKEKLHKMIKGECK